MPQRFSTNDETQAYIANLEEEYNKLVDYHNQGREAYEQLATEYDTLADEFDEIQRKRQQTAEDFHQLAGHYTELEEKYNDLLEDRESGLATTYNADIDTLERDIAQKESHQKNLVAQIQQLESIQSTLASEITELEEYKETLEKASPEYAEDLSDFVAALHYMVELTEKEQSRTSSKDVASRYPSGGRHRK